MMEAFLGGIMIFVPFWSFFVGFLPFPSSLLFCFFALGFSAFQLFTAAFILICFSASPLFCFFFFVVHFCFSSLNKPQDAHEKTKTPETNTKLNPKPTPKKTTATLSKPKKPKL
jgi:hypothetical protein